MLMEAEKGVRIPVSANLETGGILAHAEQAVSEVDNALGLVRHGESVRWRIGVRRQEERGSKIEDCELQVNR
jgi:hypothetical protein